MKKSFYLNILKRTGIVLLLLLPWVFFLGFKRYYVGCEQHLISQFWFSYANAMARPEYADKAYWEFYNKELARTNAEFIRDIEQGQWDLKLAELTPYCLPCLKRKHYHFILMEVPALREDEAFREKIVDQILFDEKLHSRGRAWCASPKKNK